MILVLIYGHGTRQGGTGKDTGAITSPSLTVQGKGVAFTHSQPSHSKNLRIAVVPKSIGEHRTDLTTCSGSSTSMCILKSLCVFPPSARCTV